jgi:hypothetical protein
MTGYNPDEPRDERGRWTTGGTPLGPGWSWSTRGQGGRDPTPAQRGPWRDRPLFDKSPAGRAEALLGHAYLSLPQRLRSRFPFGDKTMAGRLGGLLPRWNGAARLDDATFRDRHLNGGLSLAAVQRLRAASLGAAQARTSGEMADAALHLAAVIQDSGVDNFRRTLDKATEAATVQSATAEREQEPVRATARSGLSREPDVAASFLSPMPPETLEALSKLAAGEFAASAAGAAAAAAVAFLGVIFFPAGRAGKPVETGALPASPEITYHWDEGEGVLNLTDTDNSGGTRLLLQATKGADGVIRDARGIPVARVLKGSILLDPDLAAEAIEEEAETAGGLSGMPGGPPNIGNPPNEPRLCPLPERDRAGYRSQRSIDWENKVSDKANPDNPLFRTRYNLWGVMLVNENTGERVYFDDCRRSDGTMIESKGYGYAELLTGPIQTRVMARLLRQAARQIKAAAGRPIEWHFAEKEAADIMRDAFAYQRWTGKITVVDPPPSVR